LSSFIPWKGGKNKIAGRLANLLPEHKCYVEVFAGAANLLFEKQISETEVLNDNNSDLINLFRVARYHPRELIRELQFTTHSRADFNSYSEQPGLTDIQRAARSWFVIKTAFGGKGGEKKCSFGYGTVGKSRLRRKAFGILRRCYKRLNGVYIENLDFAEVIKRYDRPFTLFFCDPPYFGLSGYKHDFSKQDHKRLADALKRIKGRFLLTINDHPVVRELYDGFDVLERKTKYTISSDKKAAAKLRKELIIANYPLPKRW